MNGGINPHPNVILFQDDHLDVTLQDFNAHTGVATVIVRGKHPKVGFYYIWVRFLSGDETRVDFDGNNPNQDWALTIRTTHRDDIVKEIEVKRVRD
jgi:hypothetical protein